MRNEKPTGVWTAAGWGVGGAGEEDWVWACPTPTTPPLPFLHPVPKLSSCPVIIPFAMSLIQPSLLQLPWTAASPLRCLDCSNSSQCVPESPSLPSWPLLSLPCSRTSRGSLQGPSQAQSPVLLGEAPMGPKLLILTVHLPHHPPSPSLCPGPFPQQC